MLIWCKSLNFVSWSDLEHPLEHLEQGILSEPSGWGDLETPFFRTYRINEEDQEPENMGE